MSRKTDIIDLTKLKPNSDNTPLVSVIVPSYNVEQYIDQCLTSILDNGYQNIELLVIDDRSTDGTVDHIKALMKKDKRIQLFHNPEDHNIYGGACRNIGLDHAKGKYVYFCDSDDYILPGLILECVKKIERLNAEICCFRHKRYNVESGDLQECELSLDLSYINDSVSEVFNHGSCKNIFQVMWSEVWDKFYLRDFIEKFAIRFQEIKNTNDVAFHIKTIVEANAITYIDKVFYVYRVNTVTSVQKDMKHDTGCILTALKKSNEYVVEKNDSTINESFYWWICSQMYHVKNKGCDNDESFLSDLRDFLETNGFYHGKVKTLMENMLKAVKNPSTWNIFDKIICIHYLPYKSRLEKITSELKRVGIFYLPQFEFYETIDNNLYEYVLSGIPKEKLGVMVNGQTRVNATNIKYTVDTFSLLKKMKFKGYEHVLFIEDDVVFRNDLDYIKKVVENTPGDFDVMNYDPEILFGFNGEPGVFRRVNDYVVEYENAKIMNMSCCALSKKAISSFVEKQQKKLQPFDVYTWLETQGLRTYSVKNGGNICVQMPDGKRQCEKTFIERYPLIHIGNFIKDSRQYPDVVVSFATYDKRMMTDEIYDFLDSLVSQKCNAKYRIVGTMFSRDYKGISDKLIRYFEQHDIETIVSQYNFKSHHKYIFSMQKYNDIPVITVDDDWIYRDDMVQTLYNDHLKNPSMIIGGKCRKIMFDERGKTLPFKTWPLVNEVSPQMDIMPIGYGATLYPSGFCKLIDNEIANDIINLKLIDRDDFLLHYIAQKNGIKSKFVSCSRQGIDFEKGVLVSKILDISQNDTALWRKNLDGKGNDQSIWLYDKK